MWLIFDVVWCFVSFDFGLGFKYLLWFGLIWCVLVVLYCDDVFCSLNVDGFGFALRFGF